MKKCLQQLVADGKITLVDCKLAAGYTLSTNDDVVVVHKKPSGMGSFTAIQAGSFANLVVLNGPSRDPQVVADEYVAKLTQAPEKKQKGKGNETEGTAKKPKGEQPKKRETEGKKKRARLAVPGAGSACADDEVQNDKDMLSDGDEGGGEGGDGGPATQRVRGADSSSRGRRQQLLAPLASSMPRAEKSTGKRKPVEAVYLNMLRPRTFESVSRATVATDVSHQPQKRRRLVADSSFESIIVNVLADGSQLRRRQQQPQQQPPQLQLQHQDGDEVTPHEAFLFAHLFAQTEAFQTMHMHGDAGSRDVAPCAHAAATDRSPVQCNVRIPISTSRGGDGGGEGGNGDRHRTTVTKVLGPSHGGPHGPMLNRIHAAVTFTVPPVAAAASPSDDDDANDDEQDDVGDELLPGEQQCPWVSASGHRDVGMLLKLRTKISLALHARPGSTLAQLRPAVRTLKDDHHLGVLLAAMEHDGILYTRTPTASVARSGPFDNVGGTLEGAAAPGYFLLV